MQRALARGSRRLAQQAAPCIGGSSSGGSLQQWWAGYAKKSGGGDSGADGKAQKLLKALEPREVEPVRLSPEDQAEFERRCAAGSWGRGTASCFSCVTRRGARNFRSGALCATRLAAGQGSCGGAEPTPPAGAGDEKPRPTRSRRCARCPAADAAGPRSTAGERWPSTARGRRTLAPR